MFQRNKRSEAQQAQEDLDQGELGAKGRRTPTRKEAEAARKARLKPPTTRKEAARLNRQRRYEERTKSREALQTGDDRYLPPRDKGPVKKLVRDIVDSRFNVAEFLLPVLVLILLVSVVQQPWAILAVYVIWGVTILASVFDVLFLIRKIRREIKARFPDRSARGSIGYGVLRSTQLRRFRLPKAQVKRGESY